MNGKVGMMRSWIMVVVAGLATTQAIAANDLSLNVSPATECVSIGQTITVTLDVANLSAAINGCQVRLNYDTTIMTLVDIVPTDLLLPPPDEGWVEIFQSDIAGDIDWAAVINGSSQSTNHTIATLTFTAIADGTASVTFRLDADPFFTKLTRAVDNSTINPVVWNTLADFEPNGVGDGVGDAFIGPPDATITADAVDIVASGLAFTETIFWQLLWHPAPPSTVTSMVTLVGSVAVYVMIRVPKPLVIVPPVTTQV